MLTKIFHWLVVVLFFLFGLPLLLLGGYLVFLGGSLYYFAAGLTLIATAVYMIKGKPIAYKLFGGLLVVTLIWAIYESDLYWLAFLPRVATWLVLGLWFVTPWYVSTLKHQHEGSVVNRRWIALPSGFSIIALLVTIFQGYEQNGTGTQRTVPEIAEVTDWQNYGNTDGGSRFAQLEQINTETVGKLKEVWRYRTGVEKTFKMTPLQVNDLLYICGAANVLMAVNSDNGEEVWRYDPDAIPTGSNQYAETCRGISYHEAPEDYSGQCPKRIMVGTVDARLMAVNAMTGELCTDFGENGSVDLTHGLGLHELGEYYLTSPPLIADDVAVVGGLVADTQDLGLPSGVVRAFNAITGEFVWAWDLGNPGYYGEPKAGEIYTPGTPNVWTIMSYDPELDLIYAPTGNASPDYWGGVRRDYDDGWSSAIVALDGATGEPRWKYQTVHHDVWDYDLPAQPVLVDVERDGEMVPSVAVPTKMGDIFLLDRRDGTPVHPIEERPVPQSELYGERLSPTQPFSPLPNFHPFRHEEDMWGLTPLDQLLCRVEYKIMNYEGMFTPPSADGPLLIGGTMLAPGNFGGFNWGSVSVDADNGLLIAAPQMLAHRLNMVTPEQVAKAGPIAQYLLGPHHPAVRMDPNAPMPEPREADPDDPYDYLRIKYYGWPEPFMSKLGTRVPCFEPPWARIAVMDLNTKELLWSRPLGNMAHAGPFGIRSGLPIEVGVAVRAGTLTTRGGLIFISSTMDATVRAYDVRTGEIKWEHGLPGHGQSTPMSYQSSKTGKQFIIVTVPNPSWTYPRDPETNTYEDSRSPRDGKGGYVIAYALED
ncbi:MAG: PQQ-binding-like beta-propeller repeat protein [Paraglaciecola sp.]